MNKEIPVMTERKIIGGAGVFLLVSEVVKQLMLTFAINGGKYYWWYFPWQLCSIPMYVCLIAAAAGRIAEKQVKNKTRSVRAACGIYDACLSYLATFGLMGGVAAFFDTGGFVLDHPLLTVHSYVWHFVIVGVGLYAAVKRKSFRFLPPLLVYLGSAAIAEIINVAAFDAGCRPINMFYISPRYLFPLMVLKELVPVIGNAATIAVYILVCIAAAFLLNVLEKAIRKKAERKTS